MSTEQVNTENSSQETASEAKTYTEQQFSGLLADKQAEVRKRQEAEKRVADLQEQLSQYQTRPSREHEGNDEDNKPPDQGQFQKLTAEAMVCRPAGSSN